MPMAAGQLATGTQAGPLGTPTGPYGAPYVPMMTHQPHSQMLHHQLQVNSVKVLLVFEMEILCWSSCLVCSFRQLIFLFLGKRRKFFYFV